MNMRHIGVAMLSVVLVGSLLLMPGCKKEEGKTPGQQVGEAIDKGIEKTGEAIEKTGDAVEKAGEKVKGAAEKEEVPPAQEPNP